MNLKISEKYNVVVLSLKGKIEGGPDASEFNDVIQKLIKENKKNIVADLGNLKYVNSSGVGIIMRAFTTVKNAGGNLKLANLNDKMKGLLSITKLNTIFEIYNTEEEATKSFK